MMEKINPEEIRIEKLNEAHENITKEIKSYEPELVNFLVEDSLNQQKRKISVTYLWFLRKTNELLGYITLTPDCVKLKNINPDLCQIFKDKGITYRSLPALKIGRLCVDDRFQKRGIGSLMIQFSISKAKIISQEVGCRFIYLDAKRNKDKSKDAIHFYKKFGFEMYKEDKGKKKSKETPLYLDIWPYIQEELTNN